MEAKLEFDNEGRRGREQNPHKKYMAWPELGGTFET
jgi:hypothetical protein